MNVVVSCSYSAVQQKVKYSTDVPAAYAVFFSNCAHYRPFTQDHTRTIRSSYQIITDDSSVSGLFTQTHFRSYKQDHTQALGLLNYQIIRISAYETFMLRYFCYSLMQHQLSAGGINDQPSYEIVLSNPNDWNPLTRDSLFSTV